MVTENTDSTSSGTEANGNRTRFGWDGFVQPSAAVAEAVATATDREATELDPIYESIDTDALDNLISPTDTERSGAVHISFVYEGVDVHVDGHRGIEVRPIAEDDLY